MTARLVNTARLIADLAAHIVWRMNPYPGNPPGPPYPPPYPYGPAPVQSPRPSWRGHLAVLFTFLALYLIACACPALTFRRNAGDIEVWPGFQVLAVGWLGLLYEQFAWYANPVMVLSFIFLLFRRWPTTAVIALVALAIAANTLRLFSQEFPADEAGVNKIRLEHLGIGFYFWVASLLAVIVGALILRQRSRAGDKLVG